MNIESAREYCLRKKAVTECFPFDEYSLVMKVMDKMFALIDLEGANTISLKCDPDYAIELREHYSVASKELIIFTRSIGIKSTLTGMRMTS